MLEPAADLGIVLATASSYMNCPVRGDLIVLGEVGLTGEVRAVTGLATRLREAAQLGFREAVVPRSNLTDGPSLPLDVRVDASAAGDVTLTTDFPQLRGPSDQEFSFNLTLRNDTAEDLTFAVNATGPQGWTVSTQITGEAQAASAIVEAGNTRGVEVSVTPPATVDAGSYPVEVVATAGSRQIKGSLAVEITGRWPWQRPQIADSRAGSRRAGLLIDPSGPRAASSRRKGLPRWRAR